MIEQFLMPLDHQFDSGFGSIANAFYEAANAIDIEEYQDGFGLSRSRLPIFYLYRHANELYLKSIITILHRHFGQHYPSIDIKDFPKITNPSKPNKPLEIYTVHSIKLLYDEFLRILSNKAKSINKLGKTDWANVPDGLDEMVKLIEDADKKATCFDIQ